MLSELVGCRYEGLYDREELLKSTLSKDLTRPPYTGPERRKMGSRLRVQKVLSSGVVIRPGRFLVTSQSKDPALIDYKDNLIQKICLSFQDMGFTSQTAA